MTSCILTGINGSRIKGSMLLAKHIVLYKEITFLRSDLIHLMAYRTKCVNAGHTNDSYLYRNEESLCCYIAL